MDLLSGIIKAFSFPEVVSQDGGEIDGLIIAVHLLMLVLFVGWIIYYFVALWKFRATNNPKADYKGVKTKTITNSIEGAVIVEGDDGDAGGELPHQRAKGIAIDRHAVLSSTTI